MHLMETPLKLGSSGQYFIISSPSSFSEQNSFNLSSSRVVWTSLTCHSAEPSSSSLQSMVLKVSLIARLLSRHSRRHSPPDGVVPVEHVLWTLGIPSRGLHVAVAVVVVVAVVVAVVAAVVAAVAVAVAVVVVVVVVFVIVLVLVLLLIIAHVAGLACCFACLSACLQACDCLPRLFARAVLSAMCE